MWKHCKSNHIGKQSEKLSASQNYIRQNHFKLIELLIGLKTYSMIKKSIYKEDLKQFNLFTLNKKYQNM